MKPTLAKLNAHIAQAYNPNYSIHRGDGYFYFSGVEARSIYVYRLSQLTLEQWIEAIEGAMDQVEVFA